MCFCIIPYSTGFQRTNSFSQAIFLNFLIPLCSSLVFLSLHFLTPLLILPHTAVATILSSELSILYFAAKRKKELLEVGRQQINHLISFQSDKILRKNQGSRILQQADFIFAYYLSFLRSIKQDSSKDRNKLQKCEDQTIKCAVLVEERSLKFLSLLFSSV